jgi:hypothetical protein
MFVEECGSEGNVGVTWIFLFGFGLPFWFELPILFYFLDGFCYLSHPCSNFPFFAGVLPPFDIKFSSFILSMVLPSTLELLLSFDLHVILCAHCMISSSSSLVGWGGANATSFILSVGHYFCSVAWHITKSIIRFFMLFQ